MTDEVVEPKQGNTDYSRNTISEQIKQTLSQDKELAKMIYAWLRTTGLKLTDY